jgi:hypothetical protein
MRYLLLLYEVDRGSEPSPDQQMESHARYGAFTAEVKRRGLFQAGEALEPTNTATTVRVRDGKSVVTDGPFAETKEFLGGFYLLDCKDLDEAIELAAKIPAAESGSIEIRPIWELPPEYAAAAGAAPRAAGTAQRGAPRALPDLQRGLRSERGRVADPA